MTWQSGWRQMQKLQSLCSVMKKKSWLMKNGKRYDKHEASDAGSDSEDNSDDSCKGVLSI